MVDQLGVGVDLLRPPERGREEHGRSSGAGNHEHGRLDAPVPVQTRPHGPQIDLVLFREAEELGGLQWVRMIRVQDESTHRLEPPLRPDLDDRQVLVR